MSYRSDFWEEFGGLAYFKPQAQNERDFVADDGEVVEECECDACGSKTLQFLPLVQGGKYVAVMRCYRCGWYSPF